MTDLNGDRRYPFAALFACRIAGGRLRSDGHETTEVGFFGRDQLPPLTPRVQRLASLAFEEPGYNPPITQL